MQAELARPLDTGELLAALSAFYARSPFVRVSERPPRVKDVVASNYAHLSGVLRDITGDYLPALQCFAALAALSVVAALLARRPVLRAGWSA